MLEVRSLTRRFGNATALENLSFDIGQGEIVGLLGPNGAGKTTTMRMLCGYLEPSAGSIAIEGESVAEHPRRIQRILGYLPENLPVYPDMLVADYLDYAATLKGIPRVERMAAVREALAATDLLEKALEPIGILSRGFRQRVGVAQAVMGRPLLLVLDEPTNGLDPGQTGHMRQLIRQLAQHSTVLLSTHIMQEVSAVCDRVLMLRDGKLALDRRLADLQNDKTLLLRVGVCSPSLISALRKIPTVQSVEDVSDDGGRQKLSVVLHDDADVDSAAGDIAQRVIEGGGRLYQIDVPSRDLERIFEEVTGRGD